MNIRKVGEQALLVELPDIEAVHHVWNGLRADRDPSVEEVVAGALTVLVMFAPGVDLDAATERIALRSYDSAAVPSGRHVEIAVDYAGPDLAEVAALAGLDAAEVVRRHAAAEYTVAFVGFSPGFAYLAGGDATLDVPRLSIPRASVPAGSVAIAGGMTAVYPHATPGGWRIIGRTDTVLFDPQRREPSLLAPGDRVTFRSAGRVDAGPPAVSGVPAVASVGPYVKILDPGPLTTVQDLGRTGWSHLGVPRAGAADRRSAVLANRLVGNPPGAAVLEATLSGPSLFLGAGRRVAVTGARADVAVDGLPARQDAPLAVPTGSVVSVGRYRAGARVYLAVSGGIEAPAVLGSRSTDTLSGLGPAVLLAGQVLPLGADVAPAPKGTPGLPSVPSPAGRRPPVAGMIVTVRACRGPRDDWIGPAGMAVLAAGEFAVASTSDRTGVRLDGPSVPIERQAQLPSEGMVAGAVQVPPGGQPIVLIRNHPTTGGYPVAAVVDDEGVDLLAQAPPGIRVRFEFGER